MIQGHGYEGRIHGIGFGGEDVRRLLNEHVLVKIDMPLAVGELGERIQDAGADADIAVPGQAKLCGDGVCRSKADSPDVIGQTVRIAFDGFDGFRAVGLIDSGCKRGGDIVRLKEEHDVFDFFLLFPGCNDFGYPFVADAGDFGETLRFILNDVERVCSELRDDFLCIDRAHTLDEAGAEILFNAVDRCGEGFLPLGRDELAAVFGVHLPLAFHKEHRANTDVEEISDDRDQFMISLDRSLEHRIAGFS